LERKNGWTLAEQAGELCPDGMQRLLNQADSASTPSSAPRCSSTMPRTSSRTASASQDETGFIKKGTRSAGVQRQYTGTSGKIDDCQLGVFLADASPRGRALIDRELYLPTYWTEDPARRADARISEEVVSRTKPALARAMQERAVAAKVPFRWVTGDEVYGQDPLLRRWLADQHLSYVLAISSRHRCGPRGQNARTISAILPEHAWETRSAGDGAHGLREYAWALVPLPGKRDDGFEDALLIRHSLTDGERAYYLVHAPARTLHCRRPSALPGHAGRSRNASRRPRTKPASTTTKSASTRPGTGTSPLPWRLPPTWPPSVPRPTKRGARTWPDPTERERDPPPAEQIHARHPARSRPHPALVTLAPPPSAPGPPQPLPPPRPPTPIAVAGGRSTTTATVQFTLGRES
jgi:hypothetical protein